MLVASGSGMPYLDIGRGAPMLLVHGSISDFRIWSPLLGPLTAAGFRVIVPSLRHYFPGRWTEGEATFTIAQHTADLIDMVAQVGGGPVHLVGHSRGGHLAFRVAERRPELLASLVLAEPGGDLDASLATPDEPALPPQREAFVSAQAKLRAGDIDGGLALFLDTVDGAGAWARLPDAFRQHIRDNATTALAQPGEQRAPFRRNEAEHISVPTLIIESSHPKPASARNVRALTAHIPGARKAVVPKTTHMMFGQQPVACAEIIAAFCSAVETN